MFAAEAAAIGFWGGIIGTLVGWLMCQVGNLWASNEWPNILGNLEAFLPPGWLFPVLLVFTTLLGLVAGVYPAWRAARLDPVEALRYE
jgi:putative ABC transport system permease protein